MMILSVPDLLTSKSKLPILQTYEKIGIGHSNIVLLSILMMMQIYDTMQNRLVDLDTRDPNHVSIYACGPTVYDVPHLGHARTALTYDLLKRFLMWSGYTVTLASNITDIDDKIIERSAREGVSTRVCAVGPVPRARRSLLGSATLVVAQSGAPENLRQRGDGPTRPRHCRRSAGVVRDAPDEYASGNPPDGQDDVGGCESLPRGLHDAV